MTAALGVYGGYKPESGEVRTLGSFASDKFDYRDQQKNMIQLNNAVGYISGYMRKMQKGIDEANQNFIQQIQALISEIFVLFAGGGDTGFDFGDLKYIFQAIGALFGFGDGVLPINLFSAAWHFVSTYIFPTDNFNDLMNLIIDGAISSILDIFGEIPILGQALQQLAVIISTIRDALGPLTEALDKIFGIFSGDWLTGDFGAFDPLWDAATTFFGVITGPILSALLPVFQVMADWSLPFIDALTKVVEVVTNLIELIIGDGDYANFFDGTFNIFAIIPNMITNFIQNGLLGPNSLLNAFNIFGFLDPSNIPLLSITNLFNPSGGVGPNLLVEPNFDSADSIAVGTGWIRDATTGRTANGAAKATVAGVLRELESLAVPVAEGDKMNVSAWTKWSALGYTGTNPFSINVNRYNGSTYLGTTQIATFASPATNQATWQQLSGTYTVPSGVTHVKLTFRVNSTATSGFVWYDDAVLAKTSGGLPQSWIFNLIPDLSSIQDFLQDLVDGIISVIRGIPFVGGFLADLLDEFSDFFLGTEDTAAIASDAKMGVTATQEALVQNITGDSSPLPTSSTDADAAVVAAIAGQTSTVVATAAQVNAISSSAIAQGFSGQNAIETFEYVNTTGVNSGLWTSTFLVGSSSVAKIKVSDGHNAQMEWTAGQTNTAVDEFLHYIGPGKTSVTDYQKNTVIVNSADQQPNFFDSRRAWKFVYGRVSPDGLTWVRGGVSCYGESVIQYRVAGGTITQLGSTVGHGGYNPGPAAALSLECGYQGTPRAFRFLVNGEVFSSEIDASNVTSMGTGFREHGMGQATDGLQTGSINQYTSNDNQPAGTIGSGVRIFRSNTGSWFQGGVAKLANNAFDSIANITPDITVNLTTGGITINTTGWYLFYCRLNKNVYSSNQIGAAILYKGANPIARLGQGGSATTTASIPLDTIPVYVTAGDEFFWGHGMNSGNATLGFGDAQGVEFYAGATLMNTTVT